MKKLILLSILCPFILASCPCAEHQAEQEMVQQQTIRVPYKYGGYNDRNMTVFTIVIDGEEYTFQRISTNLAKSSQTFVGSIPNNFKTNK